MAPGVLTYPCPCGAAEHRAALGAAAVCTQVPALPNLLLSCPHTMCPHQKKKNSAAKHNKQC